MNNIKEIIKKYINVENVLCLFIVLCPLLDIISFLYRNNYNTNISPSTIIRPVIPIIVIIYLFFKNDKKFKIQIFSVGLIYGIYGIIHLYIFSKIKNGSSYSNVVHEAQYIVNYSFMILNLFMYTYIFKNSSEKLSKSVLYATCIYIISIFISIITKTSSYTYWEEQIGYKGWFESGNSIGAILILSMFIYIKYLKNIKYRKIAIPTIILVGIFLTTLIGTRVGLFGFILVIGLYSITELGYEIIKNKKINKKITMFGSIAVIAVIGFVVIFGSKTIERRKQLAIAADAVIDETSNETACITGDLLEIKKNIDNNALEEGYMSNEQKKSIIELYNIAKELNIKNNQRRTQELIYNIVLVKNQKNINLILFGNGYVSHFRELILEMEIPAFLCNFGIIGFILYFIPFLYISIYGIYIGIKNIKRIDTEYIMILLGCGVTFCLSFFSGYTFFNSSSMMMVIVMNAILINKTKKLKEI